MSEYRNPAPLELHNKQNKRSGRPETGKMREDVGRVGGNAPHPLAPKQPLTSRRSALPLIGGYQRRIVFAGRPPPAFL